MRCDDFLTMTGNETNLPVTSDRQQVLAQAREMGLRLSDDGTRWVPIGIENTHIDMNKYQVDEVVFGVEIIDKRSPKKTNASLFWWFYIVINIVLIFVLLHYFANLLWEWFNDWLDEIFAIEIRY